ncbi:MAG: type II toxin-antitoxin system VapB family antitoxin [Rhizobiales bacterium]|nr:type II toxin-antitoxin system VapB family antitoxin [Hyphomicrobiales bacterium]
MAFHVRDKETDELVRRLAQREGIGLTEAVKRAVRNELEREERKVPLWEKVKPILDEIDRYPDTGLKADKAFFDELSGD